MAVLTAALLSLMSIAAVQTRPSVRGVADQLTETARRSRRDIPLHGQTVNQLDRQHLLELIAEVDVNRCFAKWVCDILAREEAERAAEERDLAALFADEDDPAPAAGALDPDSPQAVYLAAAARGHASGGNRSVCAVPSCRAQPSAMLRMLREMEGLGDLVRHAGRGHSDRSPLVVFGVEEGEAHGGPRRSQTVLFGIEEGDGHQSPQTVLFEVVDGMTGEEEFGGEDKTKAAEKSEGEVRDQPVEAQKDKKTAEDKSQKKKQESEKGGIKDTDEMTDKELKMSVDDEMSRTSATPAKDSAGMEKEAETEKMELKMKVNSNIEDKSETDGISSENLTWVPSPK